MTNNYELKVYLTNLGRYNEGELVGEWVTLPLEEDLQDILNRNGYDETHEEFFITDYDQNVDILKVGEYSSIYELSNMVEYIQSLDDYDFTKLAAYIELEGNYNINILDDLEDINLDDIYLYEDENMEDVAYNLVHDCYPEFFENQLSNYFDYEAYARDLSFDGFNETSYGVLEVR